MKTEVSYAALRAKLTRGAGHAFLINAAGIAVGFVTNLYLARVLLADGYGAYAYVFAWATVLGLLATLGLHQTLLRFATVYIEQGKLDLLNGITRYAESRATLAGIIIATSLAAALLVSSRWLPSGTIDSFLLALLMVPLLALLQVRTCLARCYGLVTWALVPNVLIRNLATLVGIGLLSVIVANITAFTAVGVSVIGVVIALAALSMPMRRVRRNRVLATSCYDDARLWRRTGLYLLILAGTQNVLHQADILMLGLLADKSDVGIYAISLRVSTLIAMPLEAVNIIFAPAIAAVYARRDLIGVQTSVTTTARWAMGLTLIIACPVFLFPAPLLSLFGDNFVGGAMALRLLVLGQLINVAAGSTGVLMTMTGHEREATVGFALALALNVLLNALLIPAYGVEGAAAATAISLAARNVGIGLFVKARMGVLPGILGRAA